MPNVLRAMPKEDWQLLERLLRSLRNSDRPGVSGGAGRRSSRGANPRPRTMAKITVVGEEGQYDAVEVIWDTDAGEWIALDGGYQWLIETPENNPRFVGVLTEQSGSTGAAVDDVVEARLGPTVNTDDNSTDYGWFFGLGGGGGGLIAMRFAGHGAAGDTFFFARPITVDGSGQEVLGDQIPVAYPPNLRAEPEDYTSVSTLTGTPGDRVQIVSSGFDGGEAGVAEDWHCIPPYTPGSGGSPGSLIFATAVYTGVSDNQGAAVGLLDTNVDARAWVSV